MKRLGATRAAMQFACAIGCLMALADLSIRFAHPGLAASRSALLGAMALHAIPLMLLGGVIGFARAEAGQVPAILGPLALSVLLGGLINILWLPGLLAPRSLIFDLFVVLLCLGAMLRLLRMPRAGRRMQRIAAAVIAASLLLGLFARVPSASAGRTASGRAAGPDLIVVLLDALRADRTSVYGHERDTTPHLRAFAQQATLFENAYAPSSWTKPSVATLFTGVWPASHGNHRVSSRLPDKLSTLPELLRGSGYRCGVFAENSFVSSLFGYDRGVERIVANEADVVAQTTAGHLLHQLAVRSAIFGPPLAWARACNRLDPRQRFKSQGGLDVVGASLAWLDELPPDDRCFLYLHLMKPHAPYSAPAPYDGAFGAPDRGADDPALHPPHVEGLGPFARAQTIDDALRERMLANYDERILYGDALFGRFVEGLRARGRFDDALIVVLSDHGEEFGENGLWDHGHSLQEGVLRIPLLLRDGGAARRVGERVRLLDVPATLLDAARLPRPAQVEGRDLRALPAREPADAGILAELRHGPGYEMRALLRDGHKLVQTQNGQQQRTQLFDLFADPGEAVDRSQLWAARADSLAAELELALQAAARFAQGEQEVEIDAATLERLRALGYVE